MSNTTRTFSEQGVVTADGTRQLAQLDRDHLAQLKKIASLKELADEKFIIKKSSSVQFLGHTFQEAQWTEETRIFPKPKEIQECKTTLELMNKVALPFTCYLTKYTKDIVAGKVAIPAPVSELLHYLHAIGDLPFVGDDQIFKCLAEIEFKLYKQLIAVIMSKEEKEDVMLGKVKVLLAQGASASGAHLLPEFNYHGNELPRLPLIEACVSKKVSVVKELLAANATLRLPDHRGNYGGYRHFFEWATMDGNVTQEIFQAFVDKAIEKQDIETITNGIVELCDSLAGEYYRERRDVINNRFSILKSALATIAPKSTVDLDYFTALTPGNSKRSIYHDDQVAHRTRVTNFIKACWTARTQKLQEKSAQPPEQKNDGALKKIFGLA